MSIFPSQREAADPEKFSEGSRKSYTDVPLADREVLSGIDRHAPSFGLPIPVAELASFIGISPQRLASVAKKYDGFQFKRGRVVYIPPWRGDSMSTVAPGIRQQGTSPGTRQPAMIVFHRK